MLQGQVLKFKMSSSFSLIFKRHVYYIPAHKYLSTLIRGYCCCIWYLHTSIYVGIKHPPLNTHLEVHDTKKNTGKLKTYHNLKG